MEKVAAELIINGINAVGTLLLGITTVISIPKLISNLSIKNETLYRDEAVERFNKIKDKLSSGSAVELPRIEFGGGDGFIVPRLELKRIHYNRQTAPDEWKGRKASVRFYDTDPDGKTIIKRWLV